MCAKRCAIVCKRYARCAQVCERHRRVCKCAQIVAPGNGIVGRWSGWYECRPSAQGSENLGIFNCMPVLTGLATKKRLRVDWGGCGGGKRPGGGEGVCESRCGGRGGQGGGWKAEWVC